MEKTCGERDPDYEDIRVNQQDNHLSVIKNDAKEATIKKIQSVINAQFDKEIEIKEEELYLIEKNIQETHYLLDHLRTCIVSKFYLGEQIDSSQTSNLTEQESWIHPTTKRYLGKAPCESYTEILNLDHDYSMCRVKIEPKETEPEIELNNQIVPNEIEETILTNTQKVKKNITIVVGNISKYIPPIEQSQNDQTTHKWMVYVRLKNEKLDVKSIVKKVIIFLHPSYKPNDLVELRDPPFYLCRRGWGEFPIRIQIHFQDAQNKPVDIIHNLKLDQTFTGLQTMGGETISDVSLYLTVTVPKNSAPKILPISVDNQESDLIIANKTPSSSAILNETQIKQELTTTPIATEQADIKPKLVPNVQMLLPRITAPGAVSLLKKNPQTQQTYRIVMIRPNADPNQIRYILYPKNKPIAKPVSLLKKSVISTPSNVPKPSDSNVVVITWKAKEAEHKKLVKERFMPRLSDYDSMNDFMLDLVKYFPLCYEKPYYPYCAETWEIFNSWNVGKQRASEWLRARTIERVMDDILKNCDKAWVKEVWSTKKILQWCRATSFIPPFYEPVPSEKSVIVEEQSVKRLEAPLINAAEILAELEEKMSKDVETQEDDKDDVQIIDVINNTEVNPNRKRLKPSHEESKLMKELLLDKSIEEPEEIREIYIAVCKEFMTDIVRCALLNAAETRTRKLYSNEVTIDNVYQAIVTQPKFDILTNKHLGIEHEND